MSPPLSRPAALWVLLLVLLLGLAMVPVAQAQSQAGNKVAGVVFDPQAKVDGQDLRLNGVGSRTVAWFTGYAAGLYLPQPASTPAQAMGGAGPKRLQMRMLVDVPVDEFIKAFHKGVGRNMPAAQQPALVEPMAQFDANLRGVGQVKKGDVINLDFVPAKGLVMVVNGQVRGQPVPGADHYAALLSVFLGERPVDDKMKIGLLGGKPK